MVCRVSELRCKEVINTADGRRYGYVGDVEVDVDSGRILALVVPGRRGLLGREEDTVFPWEAVRRFGADTILVEDNRLHMGRRARA